MTYNPKGKGGLCLTSRDADDSIFIHVGEEAVKDKLCSGWVDQFTQLDVIIGEDTEGKQQEYVLLEDVQQAAENCLAAAAESLSKEPLEIINHSNRGAGTNRQEMQFRGCPALFGITRKQAKVKTPRKQKREVACV